MSAVARIPEMLSKKDVSLLLQVSVKTVERHIASGVLLVHRIGRRVLISADDYRAFVLQQRQWSAVNPATTAPALSAKAASCRIQSK